MNQHGFEGRGGYYTISDRNSASVPRRLAEVVVQETTKRYQFIALAEEISGS